MNKLKRKYHLFNCQEENLGRLSTRAAFILQGKNKPDFAPNRDDGGYAVVINSDKIRVTGNKKRDKFYHSFSGYPGGITSRSLKEVMEIDSRRVIFDSVRGMLPKNKLRDKMLKRLLIFKDDQHNLNISL